MSTETVRLKPDTTPATGTWDATAGTGTRDAVVVTGIFVALTLALTWPLARGLTRDIPGDFGDPLLNAWILAWDATHLGRGWWTANIFYPHPLSLAYSEHLLPQALQILPIYTAAKNPILCYNLLFFSTFVLSGLGMFLFARELTNSRAAAFVAGLAYAFAPYRFAALSHLQVLSSAWMPFTLLGLRRYFASGRVRPLAGASVAWVLQNLSSGYYLLFFSPIVIAYILWETTTRRLWINRRTLTEIAIACAAIALATLPFVLPYWELRRLGFSPRSLTETTRFSADVYAYFTADPNLRLWGTIARAWPKAEASLFPGVTIVALAAAGAVATATVGTDLGRPDPANDAPLRRVATVCATLFVASCAALVALLLGWSVRLPGLKVTSISRVLVIGCLTGLALLALSPRVRGAFARWLASPAGFFTCVALVAIVMSFGPTVHAKGRLVATTNLYAAFYNFVPGVDGLRVPARFGMIVALALAILVAYGVAALGAACEKGAVPLFLVKKGYGPFFAGVLIVIESSAVPIPINRNTIDYKQPKLAPLPGRVSAPETAPLYAFVAHLPEPAAIVELPLGEPAFDVRYIFSSTSHWKRLVNGYSGGVPAEYGVLDQALQDAVERPDRAWEALVGAKATHAIVHEAFYDGDRGRAISDWLRSRGAHEIATFGADHVFALL